VADHGPLRLFLPGAFAGMAEDLRERFAAVATGAELWFHAFVPSGILAREILDGAVADVAVSANPRFMADLWRAGLVAAPRVLSGNRLCLIVHPDRVMAVRGLEDLRRADVRLVVPQSATDPCGQYVVELFARAGLTEVIQAKALAGALVHSVGSGDLPAFVLDGRADVGIFYASEARVLGDRVRTVTLPADRDLRERIAFVIGAIARPDRAHPLAPHFVDFATGADGQALLEQRGFLPATSVATDRLPWEQEVPARRGG
jgi:molybdate transport system substrate-binding protein